ncbi:MAG TPA: VCBS repeat-containing protein, partial [Planctomycetota bacterium]|nr:VCBS repeat-containing protein [Planctomycetota bacterium]
MQFSGPLLLRVLLLPILLLSSSIAAAGITFRGPLSIPNIPRVVTVHAGDVNGDGKLDLIASSGTGTVTVLLQTVLLQTVPLQDVSDRAVWSPVPIRVGASCFFTRAGDFDNDGFDDLAVADGASTAYFVRSHGDGTFARPMPLIEARGSRWIATGDWNRDGNLDLASSNLNTRTLTIHLGDGAGGFSLAQDPGLEREHTLEALDYDGDGILDFALGLGTPGMQLQRGLGDGRFEHRDMLPANVVPCAQYIATGDFNNDGLGDIAPTCSDIGKAFAAVSLGTGEYKQVLETAFGSGTDSTAVGDLDGDGNEDLALVSEGSGILGVYLGNGDGTFVEPSVDFGPTGNSPVFLIAADLDGDGRLDVVSADQGSSSLTVFYGREGERFLESGDAITGFGTARGAGVDDFDGDGAPDMFFASFSEPRVHVYLAPGGKSPAAPTFSVNLAARYSSLAVADFNTDGIPDLAGASSSSAMFHVALLDSNGFAHGEVSYPCGTMPQETAVGRIDGGATLDIALPCSGTNDVWLFLGAGDGTFTGASPVPTIEKPRHAALGDLDGDGRADLLVLGTKVVAVHYQDAAGEFAGPMI